MAAGPVETQRKVAMVVVAHWFTRLHGLQAVMYGKLYDGFGMFGVVVSFFKPMRDVRLEESAMIGHLETASGAQVFQDVSENRNGIFQHVFNNFVLFNVPVIFDAKPSDAMGGLEDTACV